MIKYLFVIYCIKNYFTTLVSFNYPTVDVIVSDSVSALGYEPADLTMHPPPELPRVGSCFSYRCLVFPKKNVLKGKPVLFEVIQVKRPKNVVFHYGMVW